MLIAIEGADGCGKSTVGARIAEDIGAKLIHFPADDAFTGPLIRSYLRKEWAVHHHIKAAPYVDDHPDTRASAMVFQALQVANRMELIPDIQKRLTEEQSVVLVRYWQSGYVYGGFDGLPDEWLIKVHEAMPQARTNILLDISPEISMHRQELRDLPPERYEGKAEFSRRVIKRYRKLWTDSQDEASGTWPIIDASMSLDKVVEAVHRSVRFAKSRVR